MLDPISAITAADKAIEESGIKELLPEVYKDSSQPAIRSFGQALGTVVELSNVFLLPLKYWSERKKAVAANNFKIFTDNLISIPLEEVCPVPPEIGVPILEKLTFVTSPELIQLFSKLLTIASSQFTVGHAHPVYLQIINRLSPDEARILEHLSNRIVTENMTQFISLEITAHSKKAPGATYTMHHRLTGIEDELNLLFPEEITTYLVNLESSGLLEYRKGSHLALDYKPLMEKYSEFLSECVEYQPDEYLNVKFATSSYAITDLGRRFLDVIFA